MPIVIGQLFGEGVREADAVASLQQGFDGPGDMDDDARSALGEEGCIADEMECVADALLNVEEDGFAADIGGADGGTAPLAGSAGADRDFGAAFRYPLARRSARRPPAYVIRFRRCFPQVAKKRVSTPLTEQVPLPTG